MVNRMNGKHVRKSIFKVMLVSMLFINVAFLVIFSLNRKEKKAVTTDDLNNNYIVELSRIKKACEAGDTDIAQSLNSIMERMRRERYEIENTKDNGIIAALACCDLLLIFVWCYIYFYLLKPFDELEEFAAEIAAGNLDKKLPYRKINIFGRFTWAFDHMRTEIINSRRNEQAAIENNKTIIATLSHDIKTPIASIRGYAEALTMNMDSKPERRQRYAEVILSKCDEVTKITNDMFVHSLHNLNKLIIKREEVDLKKVIENTLNDMNAEGHIRIVGEIKPAILGDADASRIEQVIENIITNSRKYARDSVIQVNTSISEDPEGKKEYILAIKDSGKGIPDEDMPFIFDKFYRGKNVGTEQGSGLGLFIVKYIMEQLGGRIELRNEDGLLVNLFFNIS